MKTRSTLPLWTTLAVLATGCNNEPGSSGDDSQPQTGGEMSSNATGDGPSSADTESGTGGATTAGDGDSGSTTDPGVPTICDDPSAFTNPGPGEAGHSEIAHWKFDLPFVLTINFDDSTPGQAQIGVPAMIERGLTGTWFVNPGLQPYQDHVDTWETLAPDNFQELANHSMNHSGAMDYAEADYEIGEAAAIIRSAYPADRSPMMGFNNGGGTDWDVSEEEYAQLLEAHDCVERLHSSGIAPAAPGPSLSGDRLAYMQAMIVADNWTRIHFHGICDPSDQVNCVCDTPDDPATCREFGGGVNYGGVSSADFLYFLDQLVTEPFFTDQVWVAGFIEAHKYQQAREVSEGVLASDEGEELRLCLRSELDPALYDDELTLITEVPAGWSDCEVSQAGVAGSCRIVDGVAHYEARIDAGPIVLGPA